jgi:hypothetical protein
MDEREPIKPTCPWPLSVAVEELTGWEVIEIEKHFGLPMEKLGGTRILVGVVHAFENRDGNKASWTDIEKMSIRELNGYFQPEEKAADPESPLDA